MNNREIPISDGTEEEMKQSRQQNSTEGMNDQERGDLHGSSATAHSVEEITELQERVQQLEQENESLRDQRLRAIAELDNARRRAQQDVINTVQYANEELLKKLLPVVDDFERSVESGEASKDFNAFFTGVSMIRDKFRKLLEESGVKKIDVVGKEFDVELHEALMRQPSDLPEGTVVAELEPGYTYKDKVIRHAKVTVSAG